MSDNIHLIATLVALIVLIIVTIIRMYSRIKTRSALVPTFIKPIWNHQRKRSRTRHAEHNADCG